MVPGAGHASTLGNRVNLLDEIRTSFASEALSLRPKDETPTLPKGDGSDGLWRGMLDRTFPPVPPTEYTRWNGDGDFAQALRK